MPASNIMRVLHELIEQGHGPRYLAIADAVAQAIRQRRLIAGDRLPPQRQLAASLGVDVTTVTRGYNEARHRGLLDGTVGRGTFVRATLASPTAFADQHAMVDMSMNLPPQPADPALGGLLREGLDWLLSHTGMQALMSYRAGAGTVRDRAAAAEWLRPVMGDLHPDRIVVCAGGQCAMAALLTTLARPGDTVLTETLTYPVFRALAAQVGVTLVAVTTDHEGLVPEALDRACTEHRPTAVYCVPTMHNPTTVTMPDERRRAIAEVLVRQKVRLIEDDPYGLLPSNPLAAMSSMVAARGFDGAFYIGSTSKVLSPGLRTAFVVAPTPAHASRFAEAVRAIALTPSSLLTSLVTHWIQSGTAAALRNAIRDEVVARQTLARAILATNEMAAHPEGLHIWLTLPSRWNRLDFSAHLRQQGLSLVPADAFFVGGAAPNAVRVCLGAAESREALRAALQLVANALTSDGPGSLDGII